MQGTGLRQEGVTESAWLEHQGRPSKRQARVRAQARKSGPGDTLYAKIYAACQGTVLILIPSAGYVGFEQIGLLKVSPSLDCCNHCQLRVSALRLNKPPKSNVHPYALLFCMALD